MSYSVVFSKPHNYTIDGLPVPSVTEVLKEIGAIDTTWYTPEARDRGRLVHLITELDDHGDLSEDVIRREVVHLMPYLTAWRKFRADTRVKVLEIEKRLGSRHYQYGGTLDRITQWQPPDGDVVVNDIKTGGPERWHRLQTAAYLLAAREMGIVAPGTRTRAVLYLRADGTYKRDEHTAAGDEDGWLAALAYYHWIRRQQR